jgi:Protein of unknown function (DUF2652)
MQQSWNSSICLTNDRIVNPALIRIPDISGFTNFIARTNLAHSQMKIARLLETILNNNALNLSVSELEGDAILFYKFNDSSTFDQIIEQCKLMFLDSLCFVLIYSFNDHTGLVNLVFQK